MKKRQTFSVKEMLRKEWIDKMVKRDEREAKNPDRLIKRVKYQMEQEKRTRGIVTFRKAV